MRLVTRSDFDGLMCAVLLREVEDIEEIVFAHPKDIQDGKYHITSNDIVTNLPYDPNCGMWFDHHSSEDDRVDIKENFKGKFETAPSAARVIYDYYKSEKLAKYDEVMRDVDTVDAATLSEDDVVKPDGWILLSYVMDPRTGLAYHKEYRLSNYQLMMKMVDWIGKHTVQEILAFEDVKERTDRYFELQEEFVTILKDNSKLDGNVVVTDLRAFDGVPPGNRFLIYTLFPSCNISVRVFNGFKKQNHVVALGHNIFNRSCQTDVGSLMSNYGGGGHKGAGTCQLDLATSNDQIEEIVNALKANG